MNAHNLEEQLKIELEKHSNEAKSAMQLVLNALPKNAKQLNFEVFVTQDGDGFFTIRANLDGPDLYVLNKSIGEVADIFDPKYIDGEICPYIPTVDPFDIEYEANDVVVDCAANWLAKLWKGLNISEVNIPVYVVGHDDYGTITPIKLK